MFFQICEGDWRVIGHRRGQGEERKRGATEIKREREREVEVESTQMHTQPWAQTRRSSGGLGTRTPCGHASGFGDGAPKRLELCTTEAGCDPAFCKEAVLG